MPTSGLVIWPGMLTRLGLRVSIVLESKECTPVTRIKKFAFQIKHELDKPGSIRR